MSFDYLLLRKQTVNFSQINKVLEKAFSAIKAAEKILKDDPEIGFNLAYEAMLKTTLTLMLSRGYRPRVKLGHHRTLVEYSKYILKQFLIVTTTYDRMRKKRNKLIYDIGTVSLKEAEQAIIIAKKYFAIVKNKISEDNPQQKLWKP